VQERLHVRAVGCDQGGARPKDPLLDRGERYFFESLCVCPRQNAINGLGSILFTNANSMPPSSSNGALSTFIQAHWQGSTTLPARPGDGSRLEAQTGADVSIDSVAGRFGSFSVMRQPAGLTTTLLRESQLLRRQVGVLDDLLKFSDLGLHEAGNSSTEMGLTSAPCSSSFCLISGSRKIVLIWY